MKYLSALLFVFVFCFASCDKKDDVAPPVTGVIFNPVKPYQEAYPGSVVTFKVTVKSPEQVTKFSVRFKLPGSSDFVPLPEYPDMTETSEFASRYGVFEYALPPSSTIIDAETRFKFIATTATNTYENEYTVKLLNKGDQRVRLYSPAASSFAKFNALDVLKGSGVPSSFPALTRDMEALTATAKYPVTGQTFTVLTGWKSANGTKFKTATAANYAAATSQYASIYSSISDAVEADTLSTVFSGTRIPNLLPGGYYLAKLNRNNVISYVGISVKKTPVASVSNINTTSIVDLSNEYLELELRK